jgi:hypothetical protein
VVYSRPGHLLLGEISVYAGAGSRAVMAVTNAGDPVADAEAITVKPVHR